MKALNPIKVIRGFKVRRSKNKGLWDVLETRCGTITGKSLFTGTWKEVLAATKSS